jgi:mono/diheme cytochrome c family protein
MIMSMLPPLLCCSAVLLASASAFAVAPAGRSGPPPDPRRGESLYVGSVRLAAGGAPCLACHGIAGHGLARAASFGPDLSGAYAALGPDGLESMLADVVYPSMQPVYAGRAVTPQERADLVAFLGETGIGAQAPPLGMGFKAGVAAAMAVFLAGVVAIGRRGKARSAASTRSGER